VKVYMRRNTLVMYTFSLLAPLRPLTWTSGREPTRSPWTKLSQGYIINLMRRTFPCNIKGLAFTPHSHPKALWPFKP